MNGYRSEVISGNASLMGCPRRYLRGGHKLLLSRAFGQQKDMVTQNALTLAIIDAGCLWWLTWMQFVTAFWFGLPLFTMDRRWSLTAMCYYLPPEGGEYSVPELFLAASIGLSLLALGRCFVMSKGARGRIRILFLVSLFASIAVGFSWSVVTWRNYHLMNVEYLRSHMSQYPEYAGFPESLREQQKLVDKALVDYKRYWKPQTQRTPEQ